jgi:hypothetical protein
MRFLYFVSFPVLFVFSSYAQSRYDTLSLDKEAPTLAVKISPLHLFSFYPTAQVAFEHRIYKNITLQYDLGYVLDYKQYYTEQYFNKRGYKVKFETRYFFSFIDYNHSYLAAGVFYNRVDFDRANVFGIGCTSGDCDYFEYKTFIVQYREKGLSLKYGVMFYLDPPKRFFMDFNAGLSLRDIAYGHVGKPEGSDVLDYGNDTNNNVLFQPSEEDRFAYGLVLGYRLGYRFR